MGYMLLDEKCRKSPCFCSGNPWRLANAFLPQGDISVAKLKAYHGLCLQMGYTRIYVVAWNTKFPFPMTEVFITRRRAEVATLTPTKSHMRLFSFFSTHRREFKEPDCPPALRAASVKRLPFFLIGAVIVGEIRKSPNPEKDGVKKEMTKHDQLPQVLTATALSNSPIFPRFPRLCL